MESDLVQSETLHLSESVGSDGGSGLESGSIGMGICVQPEEVIETSVLQSAADYDASFGGDDHFVDSILVPQPFETETVTTENSKTTDLQDTMTPTRCFVSKKKRGGARPNAGRKKIHELPRMQRNIRIEISRSVHERYKEQKKKLGFQNDSLFVDHLLLIHQHYIDFYANQSWVSGQHESTENNSSSTRPSTMNIESVAAGEGQTAFSEAAIQVETGLLGCPPLKSAKRTVEWHGAGDKSGLVKKGSKRKNSPQLSTC